MEDIYFYIGKYQIYFIECVENIRFSRVRSTSENSDVFNSRDEIFGIYRKKVNFLFIYTFYRLHAMSHPLKKEVLKMQRRTILANPNNFGIKYSPCSN